MATRTNSIFVPDGKNAIHDGIEHDAGGGKGLLDPTESTWASATSGHKLKE